LVHAITAHATIEENFRKREKASSEERVDISTAAKPQKQIQATLERKRNDWSLVIRAYYMLNVTNFALRPARVRNRTDWS
ncbi:MAG TPA: hypothetical protein PLW55_17050, partial [Leptospiraceae bacterium]|nr:hypothetical protein [Leptospiraceae bacterium]